LRRLLRGLVVVARTDGRCERHRHHRGFGLALLLMSPYRLLRMPFMLFVEFFRCTPAIVQIVWIFYCVPMLFDVFLDPITMGVLALGLNLTAFNAEAYRASIQAVPKEQIDAGIALGLNPWQRILHIVFPTAFRASVPVLLTNGIVIFQQSALVAIVAIADLMYEAQVAGDGNLSPDRDLHRRRSHLFRGVVPRHPDRRPAGAPPPTARKLGGQMSLDFSVLARFEHALLLGLMTTLELTVVCILLGCTLGFLLASHERRAAPSFA
jgi:polar amino acid transport system permease protein